MVKLDNWQTKAEKAAERRQQSKQWKDQKQRTRLNKTLAQQFLAFLQEHSNSILQCSSSTTSDWDIHLWVDPSSNKLEEGSPRKKTTTTRPRANSCSVTDDGKGRKGRARSNSDATVPSPQKPAVEAPPSLCAQHFFGGSCSAPLIPPGRRKANSNPCGGASGCLYGVHLRSSDSLASVLLMGKGKKKDSPDYGGTKSLQDSQTAAVASSSSSSSMDFLQHLQGSVSDEIPLGETLTSLLSEHGCTLGSIVYVVFRNMLVFDRHRQGLVLTDQQEEILLYGGSRRRSVSMGDRSESHHEHDDEEEETPEELHQRLVQHLPSQVLEYILRFLPDSATATLPRVCRAWYQEIGRSSPDLWRHLLERHQWPLQPQPPEDDKYNQENPTTMQYKQSFVSHYLAVRDTQAVMRGLSQFIGDGTNPTVGVDKDLAQFQFQESIGRPISGPTMLKMWSDSRVLVGSRLDCTLHLYDVIDASKGGTGKRCKQSLRVSAAPFANTRRRQSVLADLKLDEHAIGCLYEVGDHDRREVWLGVLPRDELLCAGRNGGDVSQLEDGVLTTFNLQSAVFQHVTSSNDTEIIRWLYNHGLSGENAAMGDLAISVCDKLIACGEGQYLIEAQISLSDDGMDSFFEPDFQFPTLGKVFLFSSYLGMITWACPINCDTRFATLSQVGQTIAGGTRAAFLSSEQEAVVLQVLGPQEVLCSQFQITNPVCGTPKFVSASSSSLLLADEWIGSIEENLNKGNLHLLSTTNEANRVQEGLLDGTFFGPLVPVQGSYLITFGTSERPEEEGKVELQARTFHVPSQQVIHETSIGITFAPEFLRRHLPISISCEGGPLAVSINDVGLFVAGHGVSSTQNNTWEPKVKRKKGSLKNRAKKDGFARGMRQGG